MPPTSNPPTGDGVTPDAVDRALALLELRRDSSWEQMQRQYRALIRSTHPDLAHSAADANDRAAALNVAWAVLCRATDAGRVPLPPAPAPPAASGTPRSAATRSSVEPLVTLHAPPGDVYVQLLEAAHEVGDVSYMDPEAGLIQVLLNGAPASAQLLISVDAGVEPAAVSFTLDAMQEETAPAIHDVVDQIARALRSC